MTYPVYQKLDLSSKKRIFAVGDIHGCFDQLKNELKWKNFDEENDFLISAGDLVDRGPYSAQCIEWIKKPFFKHVIGNHEILTYESSIGNAHMHVINGGEWYSILPPSERRNIVNALMDAPYVLEVLTPKGYKIGFLHADIPFKNWKQLTDVLEDNCPEHILDFITWSRTSIQEMKKNHQYNMKVEGIDHIFFGHTPMSQVVTKDNCSWIDTGACFGKFLSVVNVEDFV